MNARMRALAEKYGVAAAAGRAEQEAAFSGGRTGDYAPTDDAAVKSSVVRELEKKSTAIHRVEEQVVRAGKTWAGGKKYISGWSEGKDVWLLYRDERDEKRIDKVSIMAPGTRWYFYVRTDEWAALSRSFVLDFSAPLGVYQGSEIDPDFPAWTRVYARRMYKQTRFAIDKGEMYLSSPLDPRFDNERQMMEFLHALEKAGVKPHEGDMTPLMRFMTDHDVAVEDELRELYYDFETDDRVAGFGDEQLETRRVVSVAWKWRHYDGRPIETGYLQLAADTNAAERDMFEKFREVLDKSDILYAWNGFNFDFPILRGRFRKLKLPDYDWRFVTWCDLLAVQRRYFQRAAAVGTSYSLDDIGQNVLKMPKLDWRTEVKRVCKGCHPKPAERIWNLWREHPEILRAYNERDVEILERLEREQGFAAVEQVFCRIGNCFPKDFHISSKIAMLLLKKGKRDGVHFRTLYEDESVSSTSMTGALSRKRLRSGSEKLGASYEGAHVFEPVKGLHENVAALDFKSLYPSMMTLFNISPDAYVTPEEAPGYDPGDIVTCPTVHGKGGSKFLLRKNGEPYVGFIPQIFKETLVKRKVYQDLQSKEEVGSDKFLLYYRLAYSFKRLGLSFYGDIGNRTSRFFEPKIAEAVTLSGQYLIRATEQLADRHGLKVLYGDTDSVYIAATDDQIRRFLADTDEFYKSLVRPLNADVDNRWIVELEYENYFSKIFFVSKKRYAGLMTMYKGKKARYLEVKGLEFMRSDGMQYARHLQHDVMKMILETEAGPRDCAKLLVERLGALLSGSVPHEQVQLTQSIEKPVETYKSKTPHVRVAAHVKEVDPTRYYVGMKIPWIMLDGSAKPSEAIWSLEYDPAKHQYDAEWAWDHRIYPPTIRVLETVFPGRDWNEYYLRTRKRRPGNSEQDD